uniref:N-acetyltransferase domain-containing protein n=1 Tax=Chromera velia CCMP2878 TaxID=1169474 RepID=A0A0G4HTX4_9ALVE|eukprot:Cvel_8558.t1-p1 / transcript=Cvel_8558.t1 / gene=Cvel_8558 / organism=Chromera_velia_CCMP2878 / gene_product=hypothetical protein / transcript_product=hypothetical protein / location=Cvel_scaffold474:84601-85413(-) / protein_length=271 / sequence_SO=supercontig / SO=protein_coding / is_pseudo=false
MGCCSSTTSSSTVTSEAVNALFDESGSRVCGKFKALRIRDMNHPDIERIVDVIAQAFCGTEKTAPDPTMDWVYTGSTENAGVPLKSPPSQKRIAWFRWLARASLDWGVRRDGVYALRDNAGDIVAVAVTAPPNSPPAHSMWEEIRLIFNVGLPPESDVTSGATGRMMTLEGKLESAKKELTAGGNSYLHVGMLGCDPQKQGQGLGSALLKLLCELADADRVDTYLDTVGKRNKEFYDRKGNFKVMTHVAVEQKGCTLDAEGGVAIMKRSPA